MNDKVELRKRRDFSENISSVFQIIRTEFKQFVGAIILIAGPLMLVVSIAIAYVTLNAMDTFSTMDPGSDSSSDVFFGRYVQITFSYVALWLGYTFISIVTCAYLKVYLEVKKATDITTNMVWNETRKNLLRVTMASILNLIIIAFATLFLVVPGLIMWVYLSLVIPIMIIEGESYSKAFDKSFKYLTNNFWITVGIAIVVGLIAYMISFAFSIPNIILSFVWQFNSIETMNNSGGNSAMGETFSFIFLASTIIANLARLLTYCIPTLSLGLHYYNLKEQKDSTGLMDQIANMGQTIIVEDETY